MPKKEQGESHKNVQDLAVEFLITNPDFRHDHVLVTSDGACFAPSIKGSNSALNHAAKLDDKTIIEVKK